MITKLTCLNRKNTSNKSKHLLDENELKKLKTFDSSYFIGKSHFEEDGTQNYLVFQPMYRYFNRTAGVGNDNYIYYWLSKGLSDEKFNIRTPNHSNSPNLDYYGTKTRVEFNGSVTQCFDSVTFNNKVVKIYIVYEISKSFNISDYPTPEKCLFGAVSLTKNADVDRYGYSGCGIGFDRNGGFSFPGTRSGRNVIIFGVDMISSTKIDKREKYSLILGKGPIQGLEHTLSAEKTNSINFTEQNKKLFELVLCQCKQLFVC